MNAATVRNEVQDVVKLLASRDPNFAATIQKKISPDGILEIPIYIARGHDKIRDLVNLHASFTVDSEVGQVKWDDKSETATFSVKNVYALPLEDAPWPLSTASGIRFTVKWEDVDVKVTPDNNHPSSSDSTVPTRYHIARVTKPARPPRHGLLTAPYHLFIFLIRLVAPYVIGVLVAVMKFFQRNPLRNGIVSVSFAAVREFLQFVWSVVMSFLPFSTKQRIGTVLHESSPEAVNGHSKAPDTDMEEKPEVEEPNLKAVGTKSKSEDVKSTAEVTQSGAAVTMPKAEEAKPKIEPKEKRKGEEKAKQGESQKFESEKTVTDDKTAAAQSEQSEDTPVLKLNEPAPENEDVVLVEASTEQEPQAEAKESTMPVVKLADPADVDAKPAVAIDTTPEISSAATSTTIKSPVQSATAESSQKSSPTTANSNVNTNRPKKNKKKKHNNKHKH